MVFRLALNLRIEASRIASLSTIITFLIVLRYLLHIHSQASKQHSPFAIHTHGSPNPIPPAHVSISE